MPLHANTVFEVQTTGVDTNGGGFRSDSLGTDKSYGASQAATTWTDLEVHATTNTKIKSTGGSPRAFDGTDRGNLIQIVTGGAWTGGFYQITETSMDGSGYMTLDRSPAAVGSTGGTGTIGGALATPGQAAVLATVDGQEVWVKTGTYTLTTATPGPAGPIVVATNIRFKMEGYSAARGDRAARPIVSAGAITAITMFSGVSGDFQLFVNLKADGNSQSTVSGFTGGNRTFFEFCEALDCPTNGFNGGTLATSCQASGCGTGFNTVATFCSQAISCTNGFGGGFHASGLARSCSADGFRSGASGILNCTADGCGGDGFDLVDSTSGFVLNCLATNNTGYGYRAYGAGSLINCADYNNTAGRSTGTTKQNVNPITLTADPYVNRAGGDFRPNSTVGGGAELRGAGVGTWGQTDNKDIGAVQHTDPAGGGARNVLIGG